MIKSIERIDRRLDNRYQKMVKESIHVNQSVSADHKAIITSNKSFARTQATWRFYHNEKTTLQKLFELLLEICKEGVNTSCNKFALRMHDWSRIKYRRHHRKQDTYAVTHAHDVGYNLQTNLLVNDIDGEPISPVAQR